jgi:hypothetical protein
VSHRTFRHHDEVPASVPSPIYRQLCREWVELNTLTSSTTTVRRWARLEPALAGHTRPGDIVDAIDTASPTVQNDMLAALTRLLQAGHQLAGRVVLQAMLPKLLRITLRTSATSADNAWIEDRHHITLAEFWEVLATYPLHRRPNKIASNLALDTLHRVSGVRRPAPDIPLDPTELSTSMPNRFRTVDDPAHAIELSPHADLTQVITWGITREVITPTEGAVLADVYLPRQRRTRIADAAQTWGITQAAVRQRCSRARRRLSDATQADLTSGVRPVTAAVTA